MIADRQTLDLALTVGLGIMALVALGCVTLLVLWLPRQVARMMTFERQQRDAARTEADRAEEERDELRRAAQVAIHVLVEEARAAAQGRQRAEEERDELRRTAQDAITRALAAGLGEYARLVEHLQQRLPPIASIADELRRDEASARALLWYLWRLLDETHPGLPRPPEPPPFVANGPETVAASDERAARHAALPPPCAAALAAEIPLSVEERIARRFDELVRAATQRGDHIGHCNSIFCGERSCSCGCTPCIGYQQVWAQAKEEVLRAGTQAAGMGRRPAPRSGVDRGPDRTTPVEPAAQQKASPSAPTLVSMRAVAEGADRQVEVRGARRPDPHVVIERRTS